MADKIYYDLIPSNGGRPRKVLNEQGIQTVEQLARIACTESEIQAILGISNDTAHNEDNDELFRTAFENGREQGKASLRRKQYEVAMKGNPTMLVWLGKQYLGQSEKIQADLSTDDEKRAEMKAFMEAIKGGEKKD